MMTRPLVAALSSVVLAGFAAMAASAGPGDVASAPCAVRAGFNPVIDGEFAEWDALGAPKDGEPWQSRQTDPRGDATGAFDVLSARAVAVGSELFVAFDLAREITLQSGPADEGHLSLIAALPGGRSITMDLRRRQVTLADPDGRLDDSHWSMLSLRTAPTFASDRFEIGLNLEALGLGSDVSIAINFGGSDSLDEPLVVRLGGERLPTGVRDHAREPATDIRIANLNTHHEGLVDPLTRDQLARMVRAVDADVYTFQEEWKTSADEIRVRLAEINPGERGGAWHVHKLDGCVIATRWPLEAATSHNNRYAAAVVQTPSGGRVLVASVHPKCCGFTGSPEDEQRVEQMSDVARTIADVRAATGDRGPLGAVVIGDWNLVGSRRPLDVLTAEATGLRRLPLLDLTDRHAYTYYDQRGSFTPGILDIVAYGPAELSPVKGYTVETTVLPAETLESLGLELGDSRGSDHLMLVADFALRP